MRYVLQDEQELARNRRKEERGREEEKGEGENCEQIHTSDKNKGTHQKLLRGFCPLRGGGGPPLSANGFLIK